MTTQSASELLDLAAYAYLCSGGLGLTELEVKEHRSFIGSSDAPSIVAGGKAWPRLFAIKKGARKGVFRHPAQRATAEESVNV